MGDKAGVDAHHGAAEPDKGRGGVLSKVFNGGRQRKKSQEAIQSTVTTQIRRSSKVEHVHNPDFFEVGAYRDVPANIFQYTQPDNT